jgi:hypothetical protein
LDWLTFFSTDIKFLAWPTAAIVALFLLRAELRGLVRTLGIRLRSFKGFGFETTFAEAVDQVEVLLPAPEVREITRLEGDPAQRIENISALAQLPPAYIVSHAWLRLDQAIREAVNRPPLRPGNRRHLAVDYLNLASVQGILTNDETPAVRRLRELRNLAAHSIDPAISMTDALRYHDMAEALITTIQERSARKKPQ